MSSFLARKNRQSHINRIKRAAPIVAAAGAALWSIHSAMATDYSWIHLNSGDASGSWGDPANWSSSAAGTVPSTTADAALFSELDITADSIISLNAPTTVGGLNQGALNNSITRGFDDTDYSTPANWFINATSSTPSDNTNILTYANANAGNFDPITVSAFNPSVSGGALTATINARLSNVGTPSEGTFSLASNGFGTLALTADNSGLTGIFRIQNGTMKLDFTKAWSPTVNILGDSSANGALHASHFEFLTGTLLLQGKDGVTNTQTFSNGTTFLYDLSRIVVNSGAGGTMNLNLGSLHHNSDLNISRGAVLDVTLPASGSVTFQDGDGFPPDVATSIPILTAASAGTTGPIKDFFGTPAVTVNNMADFGVDAGGGNIKASADVAGFYTASTATSLSGNADVVGNVTLGGGTQLNSMRFNSGANTVDLGGNTVNTSAILQTAASGASAINNGNIAGDITNGGTFGDMMILVNGSNPLTIGANITDASGGTVSITKGGSGTLVMAGTNTNTGRTFIHGGTVVLTGTMGYREVGGSETNTEIAPGHGEVGTLIINGGTLNTDRTIIGGNSDNTVGGNGTLILNSGEINSGQWFAVGNGGNGNFINNGGTLNVNVNGGTQMEIALFRANKSAVTLNSGAINLYNNANITIGSAGTTGLRTFQQQGTFNQNGGTVTFYSDAGTTVGGTGVLNIGGNGGGAVGGGTYTYNLNGGVLNVGAIAHPGGANSTGRLVFNGGTLVPTRSNDAFIAGLTQSVISTGGAKIDTGSFNVGTSVPFDHDTALGSTPDGGLVKNGSGILKLTGSTPGTYTGPTVINAGTVQLAFGGVGVQVARYSFDGLPTGALAQGTVVPNTGSIGASLNGSVNNNDNIVAPGTSGTSIIPDGKFGSAIHFDGNGSSVDVASKIVDTSGQGSNWTISLWMRDPQGGSTFLGKNQGGPGPTTGQPPTAATWDVGQSQYYLSNILPANGAPAPDGTISGENDGAFSGTIPVIVRHSGDFAGTTADFAIPKADNTWHMLTIVGTGTAGGNAELFYVDGVLATMQKQNFNNPDTASFSRLGKRIGFLGDGGRNFNGDMDEFSFFPISLTAAQVLELMNTNTVSAGIPNAPGALPITTPVNITAAGAALDLNGSNQTIGSLAGVPGSILDTGVGGGRLTTGGDNTNTTFAGNVIGNGGITKAGTGNFTLSGTNTYSGKTVVQAGKLILSGAAQTPVLSGGGADVQGGRLVLDYNGGSDPATTVKGILTTGFGQSPKFSSGQIITTNAPATDKGLGWKDDTAVKQVSIAYTYYGDANLDGQVDVTDLGALATNWQTSNVWAGGDFNYDGFVDVTDLGALATNWQKGVGSPLGPGSLQAALASVGLGGVSVPEPASIGLIGIGLAAAASRRRKRRTRDA